MLVRKVNTLLVSTSIVILLLITFIPETISFSFPFFVFMVLILGIPHGSLDHIIYLKKKAKSPKEIAGFIVKYVVIMIIAGLLWYRFPSFMLIFFLIVSGYHFGQSQLYHIKGLSNLFKNSLFLSWGIFILAMIIRLNFVECLQIFQSFELATNLGWMNKSILNISIAGSLLFLVTGFITLLYRNKIRNTQLLYEVLAIVMLVGITFYSNAVFAFAVYFGLWHSFKSLVLEYIDLKAESSSFRMKNFIIALLPFSILAIGFLIGTYQFSQSYSIGISPYMLFIILISTLTFPHLFVMDGLYQSESTKNID